jgi:gliding motility-associated-like protein
MIQVHPSPVSKFIVDKDETDICHSTIHFTDQSEGGLTYFYMFDDLEGTTVQNPSYTFKEDGMFYPIQYVTNEFLCIDSSFEKVTILPYTIYIPNTFTPDGDGFNNEFKVVTYLPAQSWNFKIYNRWGEIIFQSTDQNEFWNGTYKGQKAPDGIYNYHLIYESCESSDNVHELHGFVTLIR